MIKLEAQQIKTESDDPFTKIFKPNEPNSVKKTKRRSFTRWTQEQNNIYAIFLRREAQVFESEWKKRSTKVFMRLSKLLSTKTANQCKSHHQKMMQYCGSHENIIKKYLVFDFEQFNYFSPPQIQIKVQQQEPEPCVLRYDDNVSQHLLRCAVISQMNYALYYQSLMMMNELNYDEGEKNQIGNIVNDK